jgi:FtsZ-binding cell division protein ZapB
MRESFETKMFETSIQITRQAENQLVEEKHHYQELINSLNGKLSDLDSKCKFSEQRVAVLTEENNKLVEQVKDGYTELQEERNKINEERADFDEKFKLFGDEI